MAIPLTLIAYYAYDSPARANDLDLIDTKAYALPGNITAGIQHGSWSQPNAPGKIPSETALNSNQHPVLGDLEYTKQDILHVEEWVKRHVETTW